MRATTPLRAYVDNRRDIVDPHQIDGFVTHYSLPAIEATGEPILEESLHIASAKLRLRGGEVLVSKLNPRKARVVVVPQNLNGVTLASPEFIALIPSRIDQQFLAYLLRATTTTEWLDASVRSVTRSHQRVEPETLFQMQIHAPAFAQQRRIADFLDDQVARIDNIIAARHSQLDLLQSATSSHLAEILSGPTTPLKHLLELPPCYGVLVPKFVDDGVPFIRIKDLSSACTRSALPMISEKQSTEYRRTLVTRGDVLVSVVGSLDKATVVTQELAGSNIARAVARLQPRPEIPSTLLLGWLRSTAYLDQARMATGGDTAQPTLNMSDISSFLVDLPPDPKSATIRIKLVFAQAAASRDSLTRMAGLLEELKRSLITAAVTGEFDVTTADGSQVLAGAGS